MVTPNQVLAVQYTRSGCRVIPCRHNSPNEKGSYLSWKDAASNDPAIVQAFWEKNPDALVGLLCNQNNLVVIDCDRKPVKPGSDRPFVDGVANFLEFCRTNGIDLSGALIVETPSGGLHIIFSSAKPYSNSTASLPAGIDVRANGYIIAPGSIYPDGRVYRIISGSWETITPLPAALEPFLKPLGDKQADTPPMSSQARPKATEHERGYAAKALRDECAKLPALPVGTRNSGLNTAAHSIATMVAAGWLDSQTAWDALWVASASYRADEGDTAARNTMKSGWKAGLLKPRAPLGELPLAFDPNTFKFMPEDVPFPKVERDSEVEAIKMSDIQMKPITWLWKHFIALAMFLLLTGEGGCGKSTKAFKIAATISNGGEWPDGTKCPNAGNVLI